MIYAGTNTVVTATTDGFATGLTDALGVRVIDLTGNTIKARTTSGITELVAGSGFYVASIDLTTATTPAGHYFVFWDDGSVAPDHNASEDLMLHVTTTLNSAMQVLAQGMTGHNAENIAVGLFIA